MDRFIFYLHIIIYIYIVSWVDREIMQIQTKFQTIKTAVICL